MSTKATHLLAYIEHMDAGVYDKVWQAYAAVGDDKAVGVVGDERRYGRIVTVRVVDSIDYARMFEGDVDREKNGMPLRFAQPTEVSISPATHGIWERLQNNKMRWTFRVFCPPNLP